MAVKTAEQQNTERRAAKARQQAAAKARALNKDKNQRFEMADAVHDQAKRRRFEQMKQMNRQQEIQETFDTILARGALRFAMDKMWKREEWMQYAYGVVKLIQAANEKQDSPRINYNRSWKEDGVLVAGVERQRIK